MNGFARFWIDDALSSAAESWSLHTQDEDVLRYIALRDIEWARRWLRQGYVTAAELAEYTASIVGLFNARVLELEDLARAKAAA